MNENKQVKMQWVELLVADHTHFGEVCKKGSAIELRDDQAKRLIEAGRAKVTQAPKHD